VVIVSYSRTEDLSVRIPDIELGVGNSHSNPIVLKIHCNAKICIFMSYVHMYCHASILIVAMQLHRYIFS
jgi:hypothetical protein